MPFFSVVIPLYNKEKYVAQTLQCVLNQSFTDFEVLIVNDGSTDESVKVVEQFDDERIKIFHQENQGVSAARNKGIEIEFLISRLKSQLCVLPVPPNSLTDKFGFPLSNKIASTYFEISIASFTELWSIT